MKQNLNLTNAIKYDIMNTSRAMKGDNNNASE